MMFGYHVKVLLHAHLLLYGFLSTVSSLEQHAAESRSPRKVTVSINRTFQYVATSSVSKEEQRSTECHTQIGDEEVYAITDYSGSAAMHNISIRAGKDPYVQCNEYCLAHNVSRKTCNWLMHLVDAKESVTPTPLGNASFNKNHVTFTKNILLKSLLLDKNTTLLMLQNHKPASNPIIGSFLLSIVDSIGKLDIMEYYMHVHQTTNHNVKDVKVDQLNQVLTQAINICVLEMIMVPICDQVIQQVYQLFGMNRPLHFDDKSGNAPIHAPPLHHNRPWESLGRGGKGLNKHVLITGGAGFLGRHFAYHFCTMGWHVTVVDNLFSPHATPPHRWPKSLQCITPPLLEFRRVDCATYFKSPHSQKSWDLVLHLAAVRRPWDSKAALSTGNSSDL